MGFTEFVEVAGNLGSFLSAIAVLVTLGYLSVQVRESVRATRLEAIQIIRSERRDFLISNRESEYLPEIIEKVKTGSPLTFEESYRLNQHSTTMIGMVFSEWSHCQIGLIGKEEPKAMLNVFLSNPAAVEFWQNMNKSKAYSKAFCDYMEQAMSETEGAAPFSVVV